MFHKAIKSESKLRGGKTRMFESALKAARFISSLGPLAKGERVDVFVCRSLALAVRPQ